MGFQKVFVKSEIHSCSKEVMIRNYLFYYLKNVNEIKNLNENLLDNVTSIGDGTFYSCSSLTSITINKPSGSISGSPWGATGATVTWNP